MVWREIQTPRLDRKVEGTQSAVVITFTRWCYMDWAATQIQQLFLQVEFFGHQQLNIYDNYNLTDNGKVHGMPPNIFEQR